jgi:hypothetical protein
MQMDTTGSEMCHRKEKSLKVEHHHTDVNARVEMTKEEDRDGQTR